MWAEAGGRELLARWRNQPVAATCFRELRRLVGDVAAGRASAVARRIRFAAGYLDPIAAAQDGRTGSGER